MVVRCSPDFHTHELRNTSHRTNGGRGSPRLVVIASARTLSRGRIGDSVRRGIRGFLGGVADWGDLGLLGTGIGGRAALRDPETSSRPLGNREVKPVDYR